MSIEIKHSNPSALKNIVRERKELAKKQIALGFPMGKTNSYPESGESVAHVAAQHEYGVGVPRRAFMSQATPNINEAVKEAVEAIVLHVDDGHKVERADSLFEAAGQLGAEAIKRTIIDGEFQALSQYTIQRRIEEGRPSTKPLIDTSHMINSVTHIVRDKI